MNQTQAPASPTRIFRKDYQPPSHWIDTVELTFELEPERTLVRARLAVRRNEAANDGREPLRLVGEGLELLSVAVDGRALGAQEYVLEEGGLTLTGTPDAFLVETEVAIAPEANKALEGLYVSSGNFCTQCEAEGFRRITYFLDRPDVMARYTTTLIADKERYPVLLSNGNRIAEEDLEDGRHQVRWEDPYPKPSYLFALVAGKLHCHPGTYTTASGREVRLEIWVEPQNADRCEHALGSLQRSMKWDEETFGLEYDLDLYMIVAVLDFNMGAMENKGLNIFNAKYVLAKPETATDDDYEAIEGVIAHEYFHNWTGNRVTCRDWFQLTLKEGLTVYRDQEFSADMTSRPVKRIEDVRHLRTVQFPEDAGPAAHPVRPESYVEMNNFYTMTVYEKGSEVVRLYQRLLGRDGFRKGMDLYFERHDGQAVTCDDFRAAMADANGADLSKLEHWYRQAGTPVLSVRGEYDAGTKSYTLHCSQSRPETPDKTPFHPVPIPLAVGLLSAKGEALAVNTEGDSGSETTRTVVVDAESQSFTFTGLDEAPVPSLLRDFSAPVKLVIEREREELAFLMAHDEDPFNRWDAGQSLGRDLLLEMAAACAAGKDPQLDPLFMEAFRKILVDERLDGSIRSLMLTLPSERVLGQEMEVIDVDAVHAAHAAATSQLAHGLRTEWEETYSKLAPRGPYSNDKASIDARRLRNRALAYLVACEEDATDHLAEDQFRSADNMTDAQAGLVCLTSRDSAARERALAEFYERWKEDPLVVDKWFTVQACSSLPKTLDTVMALSRHEAFELSNPNRARSLLHAFAMLNQVRFHGADGRGYAFLAEKVLELDALNPQVAARLASNLNSWKRFDAGRQGHMKAALERIAGSDGLSKDVGEIVGRALA